MNNLKLHVTLAAGLTLCAVASWIEWHRAFDGVTLAWAYAFEWPLFAVLGTWLWWRLLHDDRPRRTIAPRRAEIADDDPGLVAWREYLADLQAGDDGPTGSAAAQGHPPPPRRTTPTDT